MVAKIAINLARIFLSLFSGQIPEDQPSTLIDGPIGLRDLYPNRIPRWKAFGCESFVKKKCEHDLAFSMTAEDSSRSGPGSQPLLAQWVFVCLIVGVVLLVGEGNCISRMEARACGPEQRPLQNRHERLLPAA